MPVIKFGEKRGEICIDGVPAYEEKLGDLLSGSLEDWDWRNGSPQIHIAKKLKQLADREVGKTASAPAFQGGWVCPKCGVVWAPGYTGACPCSQQVTCQAEEGNDDER